MKTRLWAVAFLAVACGGSPSIDDAGSAGGTAGGAAGGSAGGIAGGTAGAAAGGTAGGAAGGTAGGAAGGTAGGAAGGTAGGAVELDGGAGDAGTSDGGVDGGVDAGPVCTPTAEVCDGIDNDCDNQVDENLRVDCLPDPDGDRAQSSNAVTAFCPDPSRPQFGSCPAGYVSPMASLGLDCAASDGNRWQLLPARADADADTACAGATQQLCAGALLPSGFRAPAACSATDDCNDLDAALFSLRTVIADADGDAHCAGAATTRCTGATAPPGTRFPPNCIDTTDCNDADSTRYQLMSVRADGDSDGYCFGPTTSQCAGVTVPSGFRAPATCSATDDCRDTNPLAGAVCSIDAYETTSAVKTCFAVPPTESFTVSTVNICPLGFNLQSYRALKVVGNGSCTATGPLTLQMTCNGLDGATCKIVGTCVAL